MEINNEEDFSKIKRKMRSFCGLCYQFFENSPYTKVCREHFQKGNCNTYDCKKGTNCIRKFPNHNSANRHTYCFSEEEVSTWDDGIDIQKCLANSSIKSNVCINNSVDSLNKTPEEKEKSKLFKSSPIKNEQLSILNSSNNFNNNKDPFGELNNSLKFEFLDQSIIKPNTNNHNNITINTLSEHSSHLFYIEKKIDPDEESLVDEFNKFYFNESEANKITESLRDNKTINSSKLDNKDSYIIKDDTSIDEIIELVYNATKIPKTALNKLKSAFKKRGLMTAEIIRLLRVKNGNWDFLYKDFKDVCTQIQGIAVYMESILEQKIKINS
jgi:hypothetical protein